MTATGPIDTSLEVAKNWEAIDMVIGIKMEGGAHAVDGHTDEGRIEAIFSRKGGELEGGIRIKDKVDEEGGLQLRKTCSVEPRPTRLREHKRKADGRGEGAYQ